MSDKLTGEQLTAWGFKIGASSSGGDKKYEDGTDKLLAAIFDVIGYFAPKESELPVKDARDKPSTSNPYARVITSMDGMRSVYADIYCVLDAYEVPCHARGHAIKKLLCAGERGAKDARQDMEEAIAAIRRSIELLPDGE